jgi:DNA-binding transcriptional MerR regulator
MAPKPVTRLLIGQFTEKTGRSMHTVRWYEAQGLLPKVPRDAGGRRVYSQRHVSWMELMDRLRSSGMTIAQLRDFTRLAQQGSSTLAPTRAALEDHKKVVLQKIADWQLALDLIDQKIDFYTRWIDTGKRPPSKQEDCV